MPQVPPSTHIRVPLARSGRLTLYAPPLTALVSQLKESKFRLSGYGDTSQHGNFEGFRNERLNGQPFSLESTWNQLPSAGSLEFDFTSTIRPPEGASEASEAFLMVLMQELGGLDGFLAEEQRCKAALLSSAEAASSVRLALPDAPIAPPTAPVCAGDMARSPIHRAMLQLRSAVARCWLTVEQALRLVLSCPAGLPGCRVECVVALHARILDLDNLHLLLDPSVVDAADALVARRRLGWLNCFSPLNVDYSFELDLAVRDERIVVEMLVALAVLEPGCNFTRGVCRAACPCT